MKRLSKKGFVLVETLIVTAFVMTLFILVYQNVIPFIGEYEKMYAYDDIDSVYASNLLKQGILRYGNLEYIDEELSNKTYVDITNCDDTKIYKNSEYCNKIKRSLSILDDDYIFITKYNIDEKIVNNNNETISFRKETETEEFFDSGKLSVFKDYVATVSSVDSFYNPDPDNKDNNVVGKYRLFVTRTVTNSDGTTTLKYTNLGIYTGEYEKYNMGEEVTFNPGDGNKSFYVLNDSPSSSSTVTLILKNNLSNEVNFNTDGTNSIPGIALSYLKTNTATWTNAKLLTGYQYTSDSYTINYDGYYSRLLEPADLYPILGCSNNSECFDTSSLFYTEIDISRFSWLFDGLSDNQGYWLASIVTGYDEKNGMAWTIQKGKVAPIIIGDANGDNVDVLEIGIRPIIVVDKSNDITRVK